MKNSIKLLALLLLLTTTVSFAQIIPQFGAEVNVASKYVWRGLVLTDDFVIQPSGYFSFGGFDASVWMNADLTDVNDNSYEFNEIDYMAGYSFNLPTLSLSAGVAHYTFPNTGFDSTTELYLAAAFSFIVEADVTLYRDVDEANGTYVAASGGYELPDSNLSLFGSVGYADSKHNMFYYGANKRGFTDFLVGASLNYSLLDTISVSPTITYTSLMDGDIRDNFENHDNFVVSVLGSFTF